VSGGPPTEVRHGLNEEGGPQVPRPASRPASASLPLRLTPSALLGSRRARRVVERNIAVYRRGWIFLVSGFFEPFFYLLSIGVGLNKLVGGVHLDGRVLAYTAFVAPGLLASSAMNGALFDATFNVFFKLKIAKTYDAMLSTPLGVGDIALGELTWSLLRGGLYSGAFLCVMAGLGYTVTPWVVLCYPGALLISFAFSAVGMAGTTFMRSWQDFDMVSLAIIPLFLFSATFYPLAVYPGWLGLVVSCTPLYQGVALLRGFDLGAFNWALLGHAAYLAAMGVVGLAVTARRLARLLLP
jgi:lipooligosaccharide transport system permease protein